MAEPSLNAAYKELVGDIGYQLGYQRGELNGDPKWLPDEWLIIKSMLKTGLSRFYYPDVTDGAADSYEWTFLNPVATLTLVQGSSTIPLPDDFHALSGTATILSQQAAVQWWKIKVVDENKIRELYALLPIAAGKPLYIASQPMRQTQQSQGQRWELVVYPSPDQAYQIQVRYRINPQYLDGSFPYAYGGPAHAETLKAACLAACELKTENRIGPCEAYFQGRLKASIALDRRLQPNALGYNGDDSDLRSNNRQGCLTWPRGPITYNGQSYT